jgi:antimicrobial peptide system SdpB family protein
MQNTLGNTLGRAARDWAASVNPWTNVYGLARTFLALGTAATLIFNEPTMLFRPGSGVLEYPVCRPAWHFGIFCEFSPYLGLARWVSVAILLVAASGWRPRLMALPHWWVTFSLQTSAIVLDGGDQVAAVLTLLLLPMALMDKRRWHWQSPEAEESPRVGTLMRRLVALSAISAIRLQVAIIYLHAAVAKWSVEEWTDGTILYYWYTNSMIGLPTWLRPLLMPIVTSRAVALFTWGAVIFEFALFMALVMPKKRWRVMLVLGIAFHGAIAVTMGLISFGMAMTAALVLYLRPVENEFALSLKAPALLVRRARGWLRGGDVERPQGQEGVPAASGI